jgi:hypothetical protein
MLISLTETYKTKFAGGNWQDITTTLNSGCGYVATGIRWEQLTLGSSPFENGLKSWSLNRKTKVPTAIEGKEERKKVKGSESG